MNEKENLLLIVDHSNILYRAYYSHKDMHPKYPWLPVIRYLDMLRKCVKKIIEVHGKSQIEMIFATESHKPLERTLITPTYKMNRHINQDPIFNIAKKAIKTIIQISGCELVFKDGLEADDIIASITQNAKGHVVVFSDDRDMRQLLRNNVSIYQTPGLLYKTETFIKEYGFDPKNFVYYKALMGDKTDAISGVTGWGPVKSKNHILSLNWLDTLKDEGKTSEYWLAMELVRLRYDTTFDGMRGKPFHIDEFSLVKLEKNLKELYSEKGVSEIILGVKKFEEVLR